MKLCRGVIPAITLIAACAQPPAPELPQDLLASGNDFVEVPRSSHDDIVAAQQALAGGTVALEDGDHNFYLAIRKDSLAQRWFLSAYAKQWFPGDVSFGFADLTLGTRVVSFRQQNDKLFVFDASDQFKTSEVEDPSILVEAWPIVDLPAFDRLPGASRYVLVDASAGLNKFGVTGDVFADPNQAQFGNVPVRVGLSFMQNFRPIADGATFEQVFTGDLGELSSSVWGTLGISLRRYSVGEGFTPTPDPGTPFYFLTDRRQIPGGSGAMEANPVKFNIHRGMAPIEVQITAGAQRAQRDFPDIDLLGAFQRGVETWNDVFGFRVFKAVFVTSDAVPDDDKSFVLVDYPGGAPFAFADWRSNPNNGETRGMSVYFSGGFFGEFPGFSNDAAPAAPAAPASGPQAHPAVHSLTWGGMPVRRPGCVYWADRHSPPGRQLRSDTHLTAQQKAALFIQHVLAHEVGHTLGLRHNFQGSLEPPSSSVMDYLDDFSDAIALAHPGSYDRDAVGYLYGLSPSLPLNHRFCTDDDLSLDPTCQTFDSGADPLHDWWAPSYAAAESLVIDSGLNPVNLDFFGLNEVLEFARDPVSAVPEEHTDAIRIALDRAQVPMSAADAAHPSVVAGANRLAEHVLRNIALDEGFLGNISQPVRDPAVKALIASQAGRMLRNEDGVRTVQLRRSTVDVLKGLQTSEAFLELRSSRDAVQAALAGGAIPPAEVPFVEDLLTRIEVALTPYFQ